MAQPVVIYVPGLLPKPEAELHREALARCLYAGLRRVYPPVADAVASARDSFEVVSWTGDFYGIHRNFELDAAAVDAVIEQREASPRDVAEATSWSRRMMRWIYRLGDMLPFLIPHVANERMEVHLRDLRRYERNRQGAADQIRNLLKSTLHVAADGKRPILLIGHSMGSVIAYDTLWELSHYDGNPLVVDMFLTMGSPLGQRFMQSRINGHAARGVDRYPHNIRRWTNLSAVGDLTAIDPCLANDFGEMLKLRLLDEIVDDELFNYYRLNGVLNVHSEYGYLVNEKTALTVANWWRGHLSG